MSLPGPPAPADGAPASGRPPWPILAVLIVIGFVARIINLDSGLAHDEISTLVQYVRLAPGSLLTTCIEFNNHMFFSLLAHASIAIFGESAWALRLPAVLFGVAAIPALWWVASLLVSRREALAAAVLLTVSPHHIGFSQGARGYTGLLLFSLIGVGLFIQGMRRPLWKTWLGFALVNAAALFTHLTAAFALVGQTLIWAFLFVRARLNPRRPALPGATCVYPLLGCVLAGVLSLLLYAPLIPQLASSFGAHVGKDSSFTKVTEWTSPLWTLREMIVGLGASPIAIAAVLVAGLLTVVGIVSLARRDPVPVFAMLVFGPIALAIFWGLHFHIWPRYFFPLLGFFLIFVVRGIEVVARAVAGARAPAVATAAVALLAAAFIAASIPNWRFPKQDYPGARDFVAANRQAGEPVLTAGMTAFCYRSYYAPDWSEVKDVAELERETTGPKRTWFVYSFPTALRSSNPGVLERVQASFEIVREFPGTIHDGAVVVCRTR